MDFYLTSPANNERLDDVLPPHRMVLRVLDLAVALYLHEEDEVRVSVPDTGGHLEIRNNSNALRQIASVLEVTSSVGHKILDSLDSDAWVFMLVRTLVWSTLFDFEALLQ
jgi:hypothetical protein